MLPRTSERHWRLRRHCRLSPRRLLALCAVGPLLSLLPSLVFLALGYPMVLAYASVSALGVALLAMLYCMHALDGEEVEVKQGRVHVAETHGWQLRSRDWPASQVRVLSVSGRGVEIRCDARVVLHLGRQVAEPERRRFAAELREALSAGAA